MITEQEVYDILLRCTASIRDQNQKEINLVPCKLGKYNVEHNTRDMYIRMLAKWEACELINKAFCDFINAKRNREEVTK